jgi:hypothetical protein
MVFRVCKNTRLALLVLVLSVVNGISNSLPWSACQVHTSLWEWLGTNSVIRWVCLVIVALVYMVSFSSVVPSLPLSSQQSAYTSDLIEGF